MKSTRYKVIAMLAALMIFTTTFNDVQAAAGTGVKVTLNGTQVIFSSTYGYPFIDENNRTQVPFRKTLEAFGAKVTWDPLTRTAIATKGTVEVRVPIGEKYILKNKEKILIDTTSVIIGNRTYLPIRHVMQAFGCTVSWSSATKTVAITWSSSLLLSKIPSRYDAREANKVSPVRDQGSIGACWAFATAAGLESTLRPLEIYNFSEDHLSLNHGYNLSQNEGGDFGVALAYLARWSGPVLESADPYGDGVTNPKALAVKHVQEALLIPTKDYSAIKRAVLRYGAVQSTLHIKDVNNRDLGSYYNSTNAAYYYYGTAKANHDIVIVGWDDSFSASNFNVRPSRDGAFICKNSYGESFGDGGYFYISYDDAVIGIDNIVYTKIQSRYNYDHIYQSDWLGWTGRLGFGKPTAYFSNVYETDGAESLKAVSFYTTDVNTAYEVYIVPSFSDADDFSGMTFVSRGIADYSGYYTIDLNMPVPVDGRFAVVVKVTTPDSQFPVAAEYDLDEAWMGDVDLSDGEGYMSYDGKTWESTEKVLKANVCLKAFTDD